MIQQLRIATMMLVVLTLLTGAAYPLLVTTCAQVLWPYQANGSLLEDGGQRAGSELIGQSFTSPRYFWGRLSATAVEPFNSRASGGSNLGPLHADREKAARERIEALRSAGGSEGLVPLDLTTASGSGLDPHISVAAAEYQIGRIARARGIDESAVHSLVERFTEQPQFGLLGEPRVNVLQLNLALDHFTLAK